MRSFEKELFATIVILCGCLIFYIGGTIAENHIISSCDENGVYLTQKGLLVCEWRTPQKIK